MALSEPSPLVGKSTHGGRESRYRMVCRQAKTLDRTRCEITGVAAVSRGADGVAVVTGLAALERCNQLIGKAWEVLAVGGEGED